MEVECPGVGIESVDQKKMFSEFKQFNTNELQGGGTELVHTYYSCSYPCILVVTVFVVYILNTLRRFGSRSVDIQTNHTHA